ALALLCLEFLLEAKYLFLDSTGSRADRLVEIAILGLARKDRVPPVYDYLSALPVLLGCQDNVSSHRGRVKNPTQLYELFPRQTLNGRCDLDVPACKLEFHLFSPSGSFGFASD